MRENIIPFVKGGQKHTSNIKAQEFYRGVNGMEVDGRSETSVIELGLEMKIQTHPLSTNTWGIPELRNKSDDGLNASKDDSSCTFAHSEAPNSEGSISKLGVSENGDWTPFSRLECSPTLDSNNLSCESSGPLEKDGLESYPLIVRSGRSSNQGNRMYMEDVHVAFDNLMIDHKLLNRPSAFYGVFDGHGGSHAAQFASKHLFQCFLEDPSFPYMSPQAMRCAFQRTDKALHEVWLATTEKMDSGTTALVVFVVERNLIVANVGDCRAVLSRRGKAIELSVDQKPKNTAERERIEAAGGFVEDDYLNGLIGVTRALGDWYMGLKGGDKPVLISEPEVRETALTEEDEFLLIACDGLWDVFSSQEAIEYARKELRMHNDPQKCSERLINEALKRQSTDNLTVVTVCFGAKEPPPICTPWRSSRMAAAHRCISPLGVLALKQCLDGC